MLTLGLNEKRRFVKKFEDAKKHYQEIFDFQLKTVECKAIVGFSQKTLNQIDFGNDIHVVLVPQFIQEITQELSRYMQMTIPEGYPLLRAIQFAVAYGGVSR